MDVAKALYRLFVMAASVAVLVLALLNYGPPAEQWGDLLERSVATVRQSLGRSSPPLAERSPDAPPPLTPVDGPAPPEALVESASAGGFDGTTAEGPAGGEATSGVEDTPASIAQIIDRLGRLGVVEYGLQPWGSEGAFFRFHCSASGEGTAGYLRHFEAIEDDPARAVQRVLDEVLAWRRESQAAAY